MSDLSKARELEQLRNMEVLHKLNLEEQEQIRRINENYAARGFFQSGTRLAALAKARADKLQAAIDARIEIRKELAQSFPELGCGRELDELLARIAEMLKHATHPPEEVPPGAIRDSIKSGVDQDIYRLNARAKSRIEIFKREVALKLHTNDAPHPDVTVTTGGGHAIVNVGNIYGNVQQVIGNVSEGGYGELAGLLQQLAEAINDAKELGDERSAYLEQVQFIARQATEPAEARQSGVVKGLLVGLRARLKDAANLSDILILVGPALARHFGFPWPF